MTAGTSVVKLTAKTALKNNWIKAIAAFLPLLFSFFVCAMSAEYVGYISNSAIKYILFAGMLLFLLMPLALGVIRYYWRMIFGANDRPVTVFGYFSELREYKRALRFSFALIMRAACLGILLFLPAIITDIFSGVKFYDWLNIPIPLWTSNLYYLSIFLKTAATVILLFLMSRYYLAPFLIVADENMDIAEAIHMSVVISGSTLLDFIGLVFSFFGWILLSVLVFPLVFTAPYLITALCVHARFAVADYNKKAEQINKNNAPTYAAGI